MIPRAILCCAALLLVPACPARRGPGPAASASTMAPTAADAEYTRFAREYLDAYYAEHPVRATRLGLHLYDTRLPDLSAEAFQRRAQALHGWLARLERLERSALT
ncbi:MAG TPA: hypothetical protein VK458_30330, partial [Myxococcaceae bacterium]|nr:hypothetical protein [Myxococcaceae bacterium]